MPGGLPRKATGSRFTKGTQAFDIQLRGFKMGIIALHKIPTDVHRHFNKDLEKMAKRVLKYALQNLDKKVYKPAGVDPLTGGPHQTKGYHLTGNLYKSGRWAKISEGEAKRGTSDISPNLSE